MEIWRSSLLSTLPWLMHGTSTRAWGSLRYPNADETVDTTASTRARFVTVLGGDPERLIVSANVHGGRVHTVTSTNRHSEKRSDEESSKILHFVQDDGRRIHGVDALVTTLPDISLGIKSADCLPVFFVDPIRRTVGIAHAGWKGIVANIIPHTVEILVSLGSRPADLLVAIGPSIGPCHYEIHKERRDEILSAVPLLMQEGSKGGYRCDLFELAKYQLRAAGIAEAHIAERPPCTACEPERFSSYHVSNDRSQGMLSVIGVR